MLTLVILTVIAFLIGGALSYCFFKYGLKARYDKIIKEAETEAEVIKKNKLLEVKEKFLNKKADLEKEVALRNQKIQQAENKLKQREMVLNQKNEELQRKRNENEAIKENLDAQLVIIEKKKEELDQLQSQEREKLEALSGLSAEEAKERLVESLKEEAKTQAQSYINDIMDDAKLTANREAKRIVIQSIQRVATETAIENSVTVFHIESDEIKGRIIGREGRNIRCFEQATGVELNIDDTPDLITITCFNPVRREVARLALEHLIRDGRIQPGRIEDVVKKYQNEIDQEIMKAGEEAIFKLGIGRIDREIVKLIGTLKYRYSYGQNALQHSMEVAYIAGCMAAELGLNQQIAKRAGLLHDIGKALNIEQQDGSHVELGYKFCKKHGEKEIVLNAIHSHHGDVEPKFLTSHLVIAADTISAARPGARKDSAQAYINRLENLEKIANGFEGVSNAFAIQAGREIRVLVNPEHVDDMPCVKLARDIRDKIESELTYPGQIKVNVIRETRAQEYAK